MSQKGDLRSCNLIQLTTERRMRVDPERICAISSSYGFNLDWSPGS
jgi:hypothetical protein